MFKEILKKIADRMDGEVLGAVLMDKEGISVDKLAPDESFDIETVAMEYSVVLKDVFKAAEMVRAGEVSEIIVKNERFSAILRILDSSYFLALFIKPDGSLGKGRFVLRLASAELRKELA